MQTTFEGEFAQAQRAPTLMIRSMGNEHVAVRFWNIGGRQRFMMLLQRFRSEFLLARAQKIEGLDWLILTASQRDEIEAFCRRYGLSIVEDA
jgi:hypothetical protein